MVDPRIACQAMVLAALPLPAMAEVGTTFQVAATVVAGCEVNGSLASDGQSVGTIGLIDFGTHSALSTETLDSSMVQSAGFILACTPGVSLTLSLGSGENGSGSRNLRLEGNNTLQPYRLFRDAGYTQEFIVDQPYALAISDANPVTLPVFGRTTLDGQRAPGIYSDSVLLTLSW